MNYFRIYHEPADNGEPRKFLGVFAKETMSEALEKAAQYYEIPVHDLVAVQFTPAHLKEKQQ